MIAAKLMVHCALEVRVLEDNGHTMNAKSLDAMVSFRSLLRCHRGIILWNDMLLMVGVAALLMFWPPW